jgi:hypothetical protein
LLLAASAHAQFSGLRADASSDPCAAASSRDEGIACVREGVTALSRAVAAQDSAQVAKLADSVRRGSEAARRAAAALPEAQRGDVRFLFDVERKAWELGDAAGAGRKGDFAKLYEALANASRPSGDALRKPDYDELVSRAESAVSAVEKASARASDPGRCKTLTVAAVTDDLKSDRYTDTEMRLIKDRVADDMMHWYQHTSYMTGDLTLCKQSGVVEGLFLNRSSNASKSGGWTCSEWNNEKSFTFALITHGAGLEEHCRGYMAYGYPDMTEAGRVEACRIIAQNYDDPKQLCANLVPNHIGPEKLSSCLSEFQRYRPNDPEKVCGALKGSMPHWEERCRSLTSFANAYAKKDPSLCGDHELCRLYMNDWAPIGKRYEAKIKDAMCAIPSEAAAQDARDAKRLIETASGLAKDEARQKRLSDLRGRLASLASATR